MTDNLEKLMQSWIPYPVAATATDAGIALFEQRTGLMIPNDLAMYFKHLNGKSQGWDDNFTQFYSLEQFKSVHDEVGDFGGIPDYTNLINVLPGYQNCYVFAEHGIHVMIYVIRLNNYRSQLNEIYLACGEQFKLVADSFDEYIGKYVNGIDLYL